MKPQDAFVKTIEAFGISIAEISKNTDIPLSNISRFKNGHQDMTSTRLFKIINAMPVPARLYFCSLVTTEIDSVA